MPRSSVPRALLIPTSLLCIAVAFFSLAMAIDYFRTLILLEWTGVLAAVFVVLILFISLGTLVVVFGLYYWLAATISPLHMWLRAALTGIVFFPIMLLASVAKILRYLGLQGLTFWEIPQVIGPYSHIGLFGGAIGVAVSLAAFLILRKRFHQEFPRFAPSKHSAGTDRRSSNE